MLDCYIAYGLMEFGLIKQINNWKSSVCCWQGILYQIAIASNSLAIVWTTNLL